jgi:hypothetical protein
MYKNNDLGPDIRLSFVHYNIDFAITVIVMKDFGFICDESGTYFIWIISESNL